MHVDVKAVKIVGEKYFQYTALDDRTRYCVLRLYTRKCHGTSLEFPITVRQVLSFPIRKVHVDNGTEFPSTFVLAVQEAVYAYATLPCGDLNRAAKWYRVIASMKKNLGGAPCSTASRQPSTCCMPGNIDTITTAFP
ncbi:MAG: hypothetical protein H8K05_15635 [Nitrospira sp.]|nr:hypothetical protein [Nitrospira sp.]